jgi:acetyltransferase-like isoleucine patch superfamily enzyme
MMVADTAHIKMHRTRSICACADIGVNFIILPGVIVGRETIVGAGAVLTEYVPDFAMVGAVPARSWVAD